MKVVRLTVAALTLGGCSLLVASPDDYSYTDSADGGVDAGVDGGPAPEGGVDAGPPIADGGDCVPETCNGEDDDCDGTTDEEPTECGAPNATTACGAGGCEVDGCEGGFGDCTADPGCETDLTDSDANCGMCGMACTEFGESCVSGACGYPEIRDVVIFASDGEAWPKALHVGAGGEMTLAMQIDGSVDLPGRSVSSTGSAAVVARLSPDRSSTEWAEAIQASDETTATDIDVSAAGIVYTTGYFRGSVTVGDDTPDSGSISAGYVWSLSADGALRSFAPLQAAGEVRAFSIAHAGGRSYVAGYADGDFVVAESGLGGTDAVIASVTDPDSITADSYGGTGSDAFRALTLDADGALIGSGRYDAPADFGGGTLPGVPSDDSQFVLVRYDALGSVDWSVVGGSPAYDDGGPVTTDASSNVYWAAMLGGSVDVGGGPTTPIDGIYTLVGSHTRDGDYRWERQFRNVSFAAAQSFGDLVVFVGIITPRAGPSGDISPDGTVPYEGGTDAVAIALDSSSGAIRWLRSWGGPGNESATDVAIDSAGQLWVIGSFTDTIVLEGTPRSPAGERDGFLVRLAP